MRAITSTGPTGSPWTFAGNSGIAANNSGFTAGNPPAPEGVQVAFLQNTGSFSQSVADWAAGSYTLNFYAAQRGNFQASRQDFQVLVDGVVVGTFTPSGTSYQSYTTSRSASPPGRTRSRSRAWTAPAATTPPSSTPSSRWPPAPPSATRVSSRCRWGGPVTSTGRPARPGPSPAAPASRPTTAASPRATRRPPRAHRSPSSRAPARFSQIRRRLGRRLLPAHLRRRPAWQLPGRRSRTSRCWSTASWSAPSRPRARRTRAYSTAAFTVTAGSHTITFQGLDSAGGDNTAFVDDAVVPASLATDRRPGFRAGAGGSGPVPVPARPARPGPSPAAPASRPTTAASPRATRRPPRARRSPSSRGPARSARPSPAGPPAPTCSPSTPPSAATTRPSQQDFEVLVDGVVVGTFTPSGTSYQSLHHRRVHRHRRVAHDHLPGTGQRRRRQHRLRRRSPSRWPASPPRSPTAGFEQVPVGAGQFQYRPTGSPWTFSGNAGISANNSGFTSGNPPAPEGTQVAFLQRTGSFSQTVTGWAAGSYQLTFDAAQRANYQASPAGLQGAGRRRRGRHLHALRHVVPELTPPPRSPSPPGRTRSRSRAWTAPAATTPPSSNAVGRRSAPPPIADRVSSRCRWGPASTSTDPTGSPWTFSGNAGIAANGSGFTAGNPPAPQGTQVAFLQNTGSFSQTVAGWAAGTYVAELLRRPAGQLPGLAPGLPGAGRRRGGRHLHALGHVVPDLHDRRRSPSLAGSHTITFQGLDSAGGDNTAFVDDVAIQ